MVALILLLEPGLGMYLASFEGQAHFLIFVISPSRKRRGIAAIEGPCGQDSHPEGWSLGCQWAEGQYFW